MSKVIEPSPEGDSDFHVSFANLGGHVHIQIDLPLAEFEAIRKLMRKPQTMKLLCEASKKAGLEDVLVGSTYCATCGQHGDDRGVHKHQFDAKNWFVAFFKALWYCKWSFSLSRSACKITSPYDYPIQYH